MTPHDIEIHPALLRVHWADLSAALPARRLREQCRCAECVKLGRAGRDVAAAAWVSVTDATPVGGYGLQLHFDDGHERGIYPWSLLRELALHDASA